jgi:hypothetical protein
VGSGTPSRSAPCAVCSHLVIAGVDQSDIPCLSRLASLIDAASDRSGVTERAVATPAGSSSGFRFTLSITCDVSAAFANPNSIPTVFPPRQKPKCHRCPCPPARRALSTRGQSPTNRQVSRIDNIVV